MAQGDAKYLRDFPFKMNKGAYADTDTYSIAFLSNAYSSIDVDVSNPVLTTYTETTGGNIAKTALSNFTVTRVTTNVKFDADDPATFTKDPSNPADVRTILIINDTVTDDAWQVIDATTDGTTPLDLINNDLVLSFDANGIMIATLT
jgi:hypothetical protein